MSGNSAIDDILSENTRRNAKMFAKFNPITGEGSIGKRRLVEIADFPIKKQWLPLSMFTVPIIKLIVKAGSINAFITSQLKVDADDNIRRMVVEQFVRVRCRHDFAFWAASYVYIKNKSIEGDPEILFRLSYPQRRFVEEFESDRLAGRPIRVVLLKSRQWGGSTTSQLYMAWLQLQIKQGLNSLIIAHVNSASTEIKDMFDRMIKAYPAEMLHELGDAYSPNEPKMVGVGQSGNIFRVPQRRCKVKIGTYENPDGCRGGDYALVHLSEVGLWAATDGKKPADVVRSACGGVLYKPLTMIVYESTPNGMGNFFHKEYVAARKGDSQFKSLFISWFDIDWNRIPFPDSNALRCFAQSLYDNRKNTFTASNREEPGQYLWWLWTQGATLEAIQWYIAERTKYEDHGKMASECPSDDVEAFVNSGTAVFDKYQVEAFRPACCAPKFVGDIYGRTDQGADALSDLRFSQDSCGKLCVWSLPDPSNPADTEIIDGRYLVVVDIGGRSSKADWSVIAVFDRLMMLDGGIPVIAAQWRGHSDIDILTWRAAQIAAFYDNALLVIESNTLETHDRQRQVDGDQSQFILNQLAGIYPNLYARRQSEDDIRQGIPRKYGFHTNVATKPMIITNLIKMVRERAYVERDEECLREYGNYERKQNGAYGAVDGEHDDILMTRAIGLHICYNEMAPPSVITKTNQQTVMAPKVISAATI